MEGELAERWPFVGREPELAAFRAVLDRPDAHGMLVYGEPGVGKTCVADAGRALAAAHGWEAVRLVAWASSSAFPLGAVAPLLPADADASLRPADLFARTAEELGRRADGARVLVMIDDAHLLDGSSAVLLGQLAEAGRIVLLATIRTGVDAPDVVATWWRDPRVVRRDLEDLDAAAVTEILVAALAGPVSRDLAHRLHRASGGNPLVVRELLIEALRAGRLDDASGTWQLTGDLLPGRRLPELSLDRLADLAPMARDVLDRLAACGGDLGVVELGAHGTEQLESLERRGLVRTPLGDRRLRVELANPALGEVLRAQLPSTTRRRLQLECADRLEAAGARRRDDAFRVATWRLDGGGTPDADVLLQAARVARYAHDFVAVRRLAEHLRGLRADPEASVLLGEACYELGDFDAGEAALAELDGPEVDPALISRRAASRAKLLQWGRSDWRAALDVLHEAQGRVEAAHAAELRAEEASVRMFAGTPQAALDLMVDPAPTERVAVMQALVAVPALASVGRTTAAVAAAEAGFARHQALDPEDLLGLAHPGTHVINHAFALIEAGRFDDAEGLAALGHDVAVAEHIPIAQIWFGLVRARANWIRGRARTSLELSLQAASTARVHGFDGPLRLALTAVACAHALLGEAAAAIAAAEEMDRLAPFGFLRHDQAVGPAWAWWAAGEPARARAMLLAEAEVAAGSGYVASAVWLWHDAARIGAEGLADRCDAIAEGAESALVAARARHIRALERGDAAELGAVADAFALMDADLLVAEAASSEASARRRSGDRRGAAAAARRAEEAISRCEGARTPALAGASDTSVVPLTKREREIADLAVRGLSAPEIGERLFVSPRTVENHLQKIYGKLGVRSRRELADVVGVDPGAG